MNCLTDIQRDPPRFKHGEAPTKCTLSDCDLPHFARGFCKKHHARFLYHNKKTRRTYKDPNEIKIKEDICEIVICSKRGMGSKNIAIVDREDYEKCKDIVWCLSLGYARNSDVGLLHRYILGIKESDNPIRIDHKDMNKLNNRRKNLRCCTQSLNGANADAPKNNKSGYKGVYWHKNAKKWAASIRVRYRTNHLGVFENRKDAATAYNVAAIKHFGEFARLNKI